MSFHVHTFISMHVIQLAVIQNIYVSVCVYKFTCVFVILVVYNYVRTYAYIGDLLCVPRIYVYMYILDLIFVP